MKEGTKVKVIGLTDRDGKQVYGKIIQFDPDGMAIVDIGEKVVGLLSNQVQSAK